jgi:hypothetical protein
MAHKPRHGCNNFASMVPLQVPAWYLRVPGCSAGSVTSRHARIPAGCMLARPLCASCIIDPSMCSALRCSQVPTSRRDPSSCRSLLSFFSSEVTTDSPAQVPPTSSSEQTVSRLACGCHLAGCPVFQTQQTKERSQH